MRLIPVRPKKEHLTTLYALLQERPRASRISHVAMPTPGEHARFVRGSPYRFWYLIEHDGYVIGDLHATDRNEIGLFLFPDWQGSGYGSRALGLFTSKHKPMRAIPAVRVGHWIVNIAPSNDEAKRFFAKQGFKLVQETWRRD